jgi:transcriptional regulator with XRE-family HTH domain
VQLPEKSGPIFAVAIEVPGGKARRRRLLLKSWCCLPSCRSPHFVLHYHSSCQYSGAACLPKDLTHQLRIVYCYVTLNGSRGMSDFGETLRQLRVAQGLGLRETAGQVGISPAYLSRIERGKEHPPSPEIIKDLARVLATDPDVLFRLSSSTDPDIVSLLKGRSKVLELLRLIMDKGLPDEQLDEIMRFIEQDFLPEIPLVVPDDKRSERKNGSAI